MARENIIFIFTDQWRGDCISAFGHPVVRTPNIDALIQDGMGFQSITQAPLCVPARMSLFSGRYVHQHGCVNNGRGFWPWTDNIVRQIRDAGYTTAIRGKLHLFWRHDNELPMSDPMLRQFGFTDPMETTGKASQGRLRASAYTEFLRSRGKLDKHLKWLWDICHNRTVGVSFGPSILDEDEQMDGWIMDRGRDFLREHSGDDRPYMVWIDPEGPHDPFDPPGEWAEMYDPDEVDLPIGQLSEDPAVRARGEKHGPDMEDEAVMRRMRALYYGNISFIDHKIGQIVEELKERGEYDDAWIVFGSDHGEMLGDFYCTTKTNFHFPAASTPLVIKPPRRLDSCPRRTVSKALVELIDIGSTFLDIAGASLQGDRGKTLLPILSGAVDPQHHREVARSQVNNMHMVQDDKFKLVYRTNNPRSLDDGYELMAFFDMENDPKELRNILDDRREEAEAFFGANEPQFYESTRDWLPEQWKDQAPFNAWGCYPVLEALSDPANAEHVK